MLKIYLTWDMFTRWGLRKMLVMSFLRFIVVRLAGVCSSLTFSATSIMD